TRGPSRISHRTEDLPRIENAIGVQRALERAHQVELDRRGIALQLAHLQRANAVLGAEASSELVDHVMDRAAYGGLPGQKGFAGDAGCLIQIEMKIPVAHVPVGYEPPL